MKILNRGSGVRFCDSRSTSDVDGLVAANRKIARLTPAITRVIVITIAMSAIVVWFIGATTRPASRPTTIKLIFPKRSMIAALPPIGSPRQLLSVSDATPDLPEQDAEPVRVRLQLHDAQGNAIAGVQEVYLSFGEFRSYDVNRDELSSGAGRIQVRGEITYRLIDTPEQILPDHSPAALELVDTTGEPILRRGHSGIARN